MLSWLDIVLVVCAVVVVLGPGVFVLFLERHGGFFADEFTDPAPRPSRKRHD